MGTQDTKLLKENRRLVDKIIIQEKNIASLKLNKVNMQRSLNITGKAIQRIDRWTIWERIKHVFGKMDVLTITEPKDD